ncbi:transcriptional activator protein DAL81 [Diaporthe eres]|uniref:Zn(2)-C6 fungal-type domain-containing protein n=1 Tax=Diaporthe vaccinii TaxID=105482 RepID=A0ABR4DRQ3_9PEZI|nr:transcriptional activator protein DAL81 [Diaporthe eres]
MDLLRDKCHASEASTCSSPDAGAGVGAGASAGQPHAAHSSQATRSRADRPCDTCRKRKSRCVKEPSQDKCVLCSFHRRACTYLDEPQRRKRPKADSLASISSTPEHRRQSSDPSSRKKPKSATSRDDSHATSPSSARSLLDCTLGLHGSTHFKYIGPSSVYEGQLLDVLHGLMDHGADDITPKFRRADTSTTFLSRPDSKSLFSADDDEDLDYVESLVRPYGPALVNLYFRTVHPSFPVIHKAVWLEKYARSYKEFSPPQLAAFYLIAMDWWEYDPELSSKDKPDATALLKVAMTTLAAVIHRPKLSTIQAGLLLLQRSGGDSWVLTSQVVALAEELGLHIDCSLWNIPDWEKGLRRRLAWAVFMQDKWSAFTHGRPSHITPDSWRIPQLSLDDFPESAADDDGKDGSTDVETGRQVFIHLTHLTEIMAETLESLYGPNQMRTESVYAQHGVQGLMNMVKPMVRRLEAWAEEIPPGLEMDSTKPRRLCSNGNLHLSYFITEIMIYRFILRRVTPDTPPAVREIAREAGKACLEKAMSFVECLRPEHLQAFWWSAAPKSLALIRSFGGLLWATSSTEMEAGFYRQKLIDFQWSLKVRSRGVGFLTAAIREVEDSLDDPDMAHSPVPSSSKSLYYSLEEINAAEMPRHSQAHSFPRQNLARMNGPLPTPPQTSPVEQATPRVAPFDPAMYDQAQLGHGQLDPSALSFSIMDLDPAARQAYMDMTGQAFFYTDMPMSNP